MKKGGSHSAPIVELPTHPHSAMNPTTKALLRNAVLEAVNTEQDTAAMELLSLLTGEQLPDQLQIPAQLPKSTRLMLPPERQVIEGPARDYHYWASFIRDNFIPFMVANGRARFTSHELFSWLENNPAVRLTSAEIEARSDGHQYWRNIVSNALVALKTRGIVEAPHNGRNYEIPNQLFGELRSLRITQ
jgi:hypothetical protein